MTGKKYKSAEGDYLRVVEADYFRIGWHTVETGDVELYVGYDTGLDESAMPTDKSDWEIWQAHRTIKPLAEGRDYDGFYFLSGKDARAAMHLANEALLAGSSPWPEWAVLAKAAGWTPPKNWKP